MTELKCVRRSKAKGKRERESVKCGREPRLPLGIKFIYRTRIDIEVITYGVVVIYYY